jgi:hypothetical protein
MPTSVEVELVRETPRNLVVTATDGPEHQDQIRTGQKIIRKEKLKVSKARVLWGSDFLSIDQEWKKGSILLPDWYARRLCIWPREGSFERPERKKGQRKAKKGRKKVVSRSASEDIS